MQVLIVDDEESLLLSLTEVFQQGGFEVVTARSVPGAIARLQTEVPDAVLVDKNLPDFGGVELVRYIRQNLGGTLPVLVMTAYATAGNAKEMLNLGVDEYIEKPFPSVYSVVGSVRDAIKRRTPKSAESPAATPAQLVVLTRGAPPWLLSSGMPFEAVDDPKTLGNLSGRTVVVDSTSIPAQEIVGLVGFIRSRFPAVRIVIYSDTPLKVPLLKNLIGAGVDSLAESATELLSIIAAAR